MTSDFEIIVEVTQKQVQDESITSLCGVSMFNFSTVNESEGDGIIRLNPDLDDVDFAINEDVEEILMRAAETVEATSKGNVWIVYDRENPTKNDDGEYAYTINTGLWVSINHDTDCGCEDCRKAQADLDDLINTRNSLNSQFYV